PRPDPRPRRRESPMRRPTVRGLVCALATAMAPATAAAQGRVPLGGSDSSRAREAYPAGRLMGERPRLVIRPMGALLADGALEQRLNARLTWPADDEATDLAVHLLASLSSSDSAYSRSALRLVSRHDLGPIRLAATATLAAGRGAGPRDAISLSLEAGLPMLRLEARTTWLEVGRSEGNRRVVGNVPLPGLHPDRDSYRGRYTDAQLRATRRAGPVAFRATGGHRRDGEAHGTRQRLFGEAHVPSPFWHRLGIVLSGGVRPTRFDLAQPGGRFIQMGLRMDFRSARPSSPVPAPRAPAAEPAVVPLGSDRYLVRLVVPGARRVELKGDVTDWTVIPLRRSSHDDDVWETTIRKPAGVYHVNVRVDDGEWAVPPGLIEVPDRFGGSAG